MRRFEILVNGAPSVAPFGKVIVFRSPAPEASALTHYLDELRARTQRRALAFRRTGPDEAVRADGAVFTVREILP